MIFSPIAGTPIITQGFGQNPQIYSAYGYDGHNGIDFGLDEGSELFAPHDGTAEVFDDGDQGYGKYLVIRDTSRLSLLAHLSEISVSNGGRIYQGDPICKSGNSGSSTGPHLHWTYKILSNGVVQNESNGYDGAVDVTEYTRLWLDQDMHYDSTYTADAEAYKSMTFASNAYLKNPNRTA